MAITMRSTPRGRRIISCIGIGSSSHSRATPASRELRLAAGRPAASSPRSQADIVTYDNLERNGRLGNQLWQIAWQFGEAERRGARPVIKKDWTYRPYFSIPDEFYQMPTAVKTPIDGGTAHFQEYHYFANVVDKIGGYFQPTPEIHGYICDARGERSEDRWASVHVRRGDYLNYPGYFPLPTPRYYRAAIADIRKRKPGIRFVVFSDDIQWCIDNPDHFGWPEGEEVTFVTPVVTPVAVADRVVPPKDHHDLFFMSLMCEEHVLSNSTFAWWGAFLSRNPQPIYPSVWFPSLERCLLAMPAAWRKFEC